MIAVSNKVNQLPDPFEHLETSQRPPSFKNLALAEQWTIYTMLVNDGLKFDKDMNEIINKNSSKLSVDKLVRSVAEQIKFFRPDFEIAEGAIKNAIDNLQKLGVIRKENDKKNNINHPAKISYLNYGNPYVITMIQHEKQEEYDKRLLPETKHKEYYKYATKRSFYLNYLSCLANSNDRRFWQSRSMDILYHFRCIPEEAQQEILSDLEKLVEANETFKQQLIDKYNLKKLRSLH